MLNWIRSSKYGMKTDCGRYHCGKVYLDGCTLYELWFGNIKLKTANDFEECRDAADLHVRGLL